MLALLYSKRETLPRESLMEQKIKFRAKTVIAGKPQFFTIKLLVNPDKKWKLPAKTLLFFFFFFLRRTSKKPKTHLIRQMQEFLSTHHTLKLYYKKCMQSLLREEKVPLIINIRTKMLHGSSDLNGMKKKKTEYLCNAKYCCSLKTSRISF